jgi:hypothetical protein
MVGFPGRTGIVKRKAMGPAKCSTNLHNDEGRCDRKSGHAGSHSNAHHRTIVKRYGAH